MDNQNRLIRRPEAERLTGLTKSALYAEMARGRFPAPVKLSDDPASRAVAWRLRDVETWIEQRAPTRRGAQQERAQ